MLYIGNFSYNDDTDSKDNYCLMPIVVEAENADEAMEKFAAHLHEVRKTSDLLDGAHEIYLDSLAELDVGSAPRHVCGNRYYPLFAGVRYDVGLLLVQFGV